MEKKALVIGTYLAEGVDSFDWWQELPNISDYDTVILDTTRIFNHWYMGGRVQHLGGDLYLLHNVDESDIRLVHNLRMVKDSLIEVLEFPVTVYALYVPNTVINAEARGKIAPVRQYTLAQTDDWRPVGIQAVLKKGKSIKVKDESYKEYFKDFTGWEYHFVSAPLDISLFQSHYGEVRLDLRVIATNKIEKPIAVELIPRIGFTRRSGGSLVLLPVADKFHTESLIENLLLRGKQYDETVAPSWVDNIEIPGEATIKAAITEKQQQVAGIQAEIKELDDSLTQLVRHKRLLYASGLELQDMCKQTLEEIGVKTKPSIVTDEFIIAVNGEEALVEVKGNIKSITKDDIAQLVTDLGEHLKATGEVIKQVLIGNAWRLLPIEDRDTKDKPFFSEAVVQIAENQTIGLLSTVELFIAYCKVLKQPECRPEILSKLINNKGIIHF